MKKPIVEGEREVMGLTLRNELRRLWEWLRRKFGRNPTKGNGKKIQPSPPSR